MKHRYKAAIVITIATIANIVDVQGWFYDDKMYCIVTDTQVRVTFQKEDNILCKVYIANYQRQLKKLANEVLYVQAYINNYENDRDYRFSVRDQLRSDFYTTYNLKKAVQNSMLSFEQQLFTKIQKFLYYYINPYKSELEYELGLLQWIVDQPQIVDDHILLLEQQLLTIQNMFAATSFETLLPHVQQHFLLRKQIAWQLAS